MEFAYHGYRVSTNTNEPFTHLSKIRRSFSEGGTNQPIMTNYAKQTQFTEHSNKRKLIYNKGLRKCSSPRTPQKQTQNKPNFKLEANLSLRERRSLRVGFSESSNRGPISNFLLGMSYGENYVL